MIDDPGHITDTDRVVQYIPATNIHKMFPVYDPDTGKDHQVSGPIVSMIEFQGRVMIAFPFCVCQLQDGILHLFIKAGEPK